MKLHLPKPLFTALLAAFAFAAPAIGLTLTDGYHKTYSLSQNFSYTDASGSVVSYSNGTLSGYNMNSKTLTLNMSTTWTTDQALFIINPGDSPGTTGTYSVGLYATASGNLNAIAANETAWESSVITAADLTAEGSQTSITVKSQKANNFGTLITSANGDTLYEKPGLRYSDGSYTKTYLNSNIISAIVVTDVPQDVTVDTTEYYYASNYTGSWEQQFAKDATMAVFGLSEISAETNLGEKTAIIVGNAGQLHLNASTATLSVAAGIGIYIGNTSYQNSTEPTYSHAALRFENTNAVDVAGNIYLVDNATVVSTGSANITLSGQVTDKVVNSADEIITTNSTLLLKGNGYNFAGGLDVTGLSLESGASVSISSAAVIGTLSGAGQLSVASSDTATATAKVGSLTGFTGSISVNMVGENAAKFTGVTNGSVNLTGITLENGGTAQIHTNLAASKDVSLGSLDISGGSKMLFTSGVAGSSSSLSGAYKVSIGELTIGGAATLGTGDGGCSGGDYLVSQDLEGWQAEFDINKLTGASGESGSLTLTSHSKTADKTVFNILGAGTTSFSGTINLDVENSGDDRKAALNLLHATAAQNAIINLNKVANTTSNKGGYLLLGVGGTYQTEEEVQKVIVRGITDGKDSNGNTLAAKRYIVSGALTTDKEIASDATVRTLHIATQGASDNFTSTATIKENLNLEKSGAGTQAFTGDLSAFNGSIKVTGGTLTLGAEGQSGTMGLGGTINVSSEAALYLYNSFTNVDLTKLATTEDVTYSEVVNGYAGATYILVKNSGSTTVGSGVSVNGVNLNAGVYTENVTFTLDGYSGDYYVNADVDGAAVVYNTGSSSAIASANTTGIILNGGNLDMQTSLNTTAKTNGITAYKNATINLASNAVTLEKSELSINKTVSVTLTGSGTFDLGALGDGVKHSSMTANDDAIKLSSSENDGWTGTVSFSGGTKDIGNNNKSVQDINFNLLGRAGSSVEIAENGVYGYLLSGETTFNPNIKLSGNLILQNGYSGSTYTFNGDFSGSGNFETYKTLSSASGRGLDFVFAGDMSQWKGNLVQNMKDDKYSYKFAAAEGKNTTIANGIVAKSTATMDVIVSNDNEVTMAGKLTAETGSTLKVTHEGAGNLNVKSVEVKGSGEVQVAGLRITATDSAKDATMTAKANTTGALKYLAAETSFTIEDMTLLNTTITAATPTTQVKLQNVAATNLALAQGKFTMNVAPTVGMGGTTAEFGSGVVSLLAVGSASLTLNMDVIGAYESTGAVDGMTLTITLDGITGDVSGYGVDDWKALVGFEENSWLGQALTGAQYTVLDVPPAAEGGVPSVNYGYTATGGDGSNVGRLVITINGLNVPEPASATLGLAALMMLCARRRRK